ncbi:ParB/RepB/Spo0J family partition protein [Sphingopyxis sp. PAMC25046]|uniref:ParB/RepB/Spo0J family partition protein n=1 Tax=Sphingopyxis sp. PAMC25046 TaxID=2565556 RepID=UPI00109D8394|nr:ParB/RepB/Spo0J family partition protein [Sphingopyxis sp. PAMC25046]QCB55838.1 ParB/RepB/Spo0J family partition protein [Sphingopyxis sp. PAMC25046]
MKLDFIDLDKLSIAKTNMRHKGKDPDVADILPSIAKRGILVPLLVRPNGSDGHFEIVAGRRRFTAANAVVRDGARARPLPCAILDDGDDADALEASILENLARVAPDEVGQWEAFVSLVKSGRSAQDVADTFGFEPAAVKRILALGNLVPRIRNLYRGGEIDAATVRHLTLASKSQQTAWLALFDDREAYCPTGHQLKAWLFGGAAIAVSRALFDVAASGAAIVSDLFGEESFFADADQFWALQMAEIEARKVAYIEAGWSDVVVMAKGDWFRSWDHAHAPKRKGGRIYVEVRDNGEVSFHEGYLTAKEAARGELSASQPEPKAVRPEVTSALNAYIDLHRHAAVRADLARYGGVALRAMLAHVVAGCGHYRVDIEAQRAPKEEIAESVETAPAEAAFDKQRRAVLGVLGFDAETPTVTGAPGHRPPFAAIFARLLELPEPVVLEIVGIVMGETLMAGHEAVEAIGFYLGTDMRRHWRADTAFFGQLRDREVLLAIVGDVAGEAVASANEKEKANALKAIIADLLGGANGREQVAPWAPRWMAFPPEAYTARGGVGSVKAHARWAADLEYGFGAEIAEGVAREPDEGGEDAAEIPPLAA